MTQTTEQETQERAIEALMEKGVSYTVKRKGLLSYVFPQFKIKIAPPTLGVLYNISSAFGGIDIDEEKVDIIKEFVKFCYTDAKLQEFTAITGVTRGLNYDLSNVSGVGLTDYAKSIIDLKSNSNIAYGVSGSEVYIAHQSYFGHRFRSQFGPYCLDEIMKSNVSARDIFNSILEHRSQTNWNSEMGI